MARAQLRQAWRTLRADPAGSSLCIASLTLAAAVVTAVWVIVNSLLISPAPFPRADTLVRVNSASSPSESGVPYMPADLCELWQRRTDVFGDVAAYVQGGTVLVGGEEGPRQQVGQVFVTANLLRVVGIAPASGRAFAPGEGLPGNDRVVIVSQDLWRTRAGRSLALEDSVTINGERMTIVGVMPRTFRYPFEGTRVWRPLDLKAVLPGRTPQLIARTRGQSADVLRAQVAAAAADIMPRSVRRWRYQSAVVQSIAPALEPKAARSLELVALASAILLLGACTNISTLVAMQWLKRARENAIRSVLGANRRRLLFEALLAQGLLSALSLCLAAPLAWLAARSARNWLPEQITFSALHVMDFDTSALVLLASVVLLVPALAATVPALIGSAGTPIAFLRLEEHAATGVPRFRAVRRALVVLQVGCAAFLLLIGVELIYGFRDLQTQDRGFDTRSLFSATVQFPLHDFPSPLSRRLYEDRAAAALRRLPAIRAVTSGSGLPPRSGELTFGTIELDRDASSSLRPLQLPTYSVQPDFFSVLGLRMLEGRPFTDQDGDDKVVISRSMATSLWPNGAVGHRFKWQSRDEWYEVVGVVADVRSTGLSEAGSEFEIYRPYVRPPVTALSASPERSRTTFGGSVTFIGRLADGTAGVRDVHDALDGVDGRAVVTHVSTAEDLYQVSLDRERLLLVTVLSFAAATLLIGALGIYGVLGSTVTQRGREFGIRMALGAEPKRLGMAVIRSALALVLVGAVAGTGAALLARPFIGIAATTIVRTRHLGSTYVVVLTILLITALAAAWRPARRSMAVDPAALMKGT